MTDFRRQSMLFDTSKLKDASVAIVGAEAISNFLCAYLSALGIGRLILIDNSENNCRKENFLANFCDGRSTKIDGISKTSKRINPEIEAITYFSLPSPLFFDSCSAVIDATNNPESKYRLGRHCKKRDIFFVSSSSTESCASISTSDTIKQPDSIDGFVMQEYSGFGQGGFTSSLVAALAADEVRKRVCRIENDKPLEKRLTYSPLIRERVISGNTPNRYLQMLGSKRFSDYVSGKKALVVGAGGIGTYVLINLAILGFDIDIYDGDAVESHNLNRQIIHFEGIGKNKAEEAAKKLHRINQSATLRAFPEYLTPEMLSAKKQETRYDVVFSCVDSWKARRMINHYCRTSRTPLFNGGVSTFNCSVDYFIPGKTHCLECSNHYRRRIKEEKKIVSCTDLEANVVMPNAIAGSLMVAESMQVFAPDLVRSLQDKRINFASNFDSEKKFVLETARNYCTNTAYYLNNCRCHSLFGRKREDENER